jgi:hypothetical protein
MNLCRKYLCPLIAAVLLLMAAMAPLACHNKDKDMTERHERTLAEEERSSDKASQGTP